MRRRRCPACGPGSDPTRDFDELLDLGDADRGHKADIGLKFREVFRINEVPDLSPSKPSLAKAQP